MPVETMKENETYNFILVRKDGSQGKPLPIHGDLVEAEVLALHLLRPGESLCAVSPGSGATIARWDAGTTGQVVRAALAA